MSTFYLIILKLNLQYLSTFHSVMASEIYSNDVALGNNHAIKEHVNHLQIC